jgi:hypothetical protein
MKIISCPYCQEMVDVENEVKCDKCGQSFMLAIRRYGFKK